MFRRVVDKSGRANEHDTDLKIGEKNIGFFRV